MKTIKILTLAFSVALMCAPGNVNAQPGTYISFDAGAAFQQDIIINEKKKKKISFDTGFRFDVAAGVPFSDSWSAEVETGVIYNSVRSIGGERLDSETGSLDLYQVPAMLNVIYKLPVHGPLTAHVGVGVGAVYSVFWAGNVFNSTEDLTFGYQGMLGLKYAIGPRWDFGLTYKCLGTTEHDLGDGIKSDGTMTHSILAAFTLHF